MSQAEDEAIWLQLRDAGFDGETVNGKDKAALISCVSKLEKEKYEYKQQMDVLLLERKDWNTKFEQLKASADSAELNYKREKAAHATLLAESSHLRKLLEIEKECNKDIISFYSRKNAAHATLLAESSQKAVGLKKLLGIEEECHKNIRKALHDMSVEWAKTKKSYKTRLAKARQEPEEASKKLDEADTKLMSARSLEADISWTREKAAHGTSLAKPSQKEALKKYLVIATECIKNIEKGLHDRKLEWDKIEIWYESRLAEMRQKGEEAHTKLMSARSLEADIHVKYAEARVDELRRRLVSLQNEYDAKEQEISVKRKGQRELLRTDRDAINAEIKELNELEEANQETERKALLHTSSKNRITPVKKTREIIRDYNDDNDNDNVLGQNGGEIVEMKEKENIEIVERNLLEGSGSRVRCKQVIFSSGSENENKNNRNGSGSGVYPRRRSNDEDDNNEEFGPRYKQQKTGPNVFSSLLEAEVLRVDSSEEDGEPLEEINREMTIQWDEANEKI